MNCLPLRPKHQTENEVLISRWNQTKVWKLFRDVWLPPSFYLVTPCLYLELASWMGPLLTWWDAECWFPTPCIYLSLTVPSHVLLWHLGSAASLVGLVGGLMCYLACLFHLSTCASYFFSSLPFSHLSFSSFLLPSLLFSSFLFFKIIRIVCMHRIEQNYVLLIFLSPETPSSKSFNWFFCHWFLFLSFFKKCLHYYLSFYFNVRRYFLAFCSGGWRFIFFSHSPHPVQAHHAHAHTASGSSSCICFLFYVLIANRAQTLPHWYKSLTLPDPLGSSSTLSSAKLERLLNIPVQTDVLPVQPQSCCFWVALCWLLEITLPLSCSGPEIS